MKNLLFVLMATAVLFSCNSTSEADKEKLKEELREELLSEMETDKGSETEQPAETEEETKAEGLDAETLKTLHFSGSEPNWALIFKETHAEYTQMGEEMQKFFYKKNYGDQSKPKLSEVIISNSDTEVEFQAATPEWHGLKFTIKKQACNDGMSANEYPYSIDMMIDEMGVQKGCGRVK